MNTRQKCLPFCVLFELHRAVEKRTQTDARATRKRKPRNIYRTFTSWGSHSSQRSSNRRSLQKDHERFAKTKSRLTFKWAFQKLTILYLAPWLEGTATLLRSNLIKLFLFHLYRPFHQRKSLGKFFFFKKKANSKRSYRLKEDDSETNIEAKSSRSKNESPGSG